MTLTKARTTPGGFTNGTKLDESELDHLQDELIKAVDGSGGGSYTLTDALTIGGDTVTIEDLEVDGSFGATTASSIVLNSTGGSVVVTAGNGDANLTSTNYFARLRSTNSQAEVTAGAKVVITAGTELDIEGATLDFDISGAADIRVGSESGVDFISFDNNVSVRKVYPIVPNVVNKTNTTWTESVTSYSRGTAYDGASLSVALSLPETANTVENIRVWYNTSALPSSTGLEVEAYKVSGYGDSTLLDQDTDTAQSGDVLFTPALAYPLSINGASYYLLLTLKGPLGGSGTVTVYQVEVTYGVDALGGF